jgi:hypothetical protein
MKITIPLFLIVVTFMTACSNEQSDSSVAQDSNTVIAANPKVDSVALDRALLLIPGVSAGKVAIGQDADEVYTLFGKPDAGDAAMQKSVAIWYKDHNPKSFATSIYTVRDTGDNPAARIQQIRLSSPLFSTLDSIGVSSKLEAIQKKYIITKLTDVTNEGKMFEIYDSLKGIAFEVQNGICKAVIIHKANENLKTTSLPLR